MEVKRLDDHLLKMVQALQAALKKDYTKAQQLELIKQSCLQLSHQTNGLLQSNVHNWENEKIKDYSNRLYKYTDVCGFLERLMKNNIEESEIVPCLVATEELYEAVRREFIPEYLITDVIRKQEIAEEIILPHLLIKRFIVTASNWE
jgi:uncharacterized protein (DUF488 family)